MKQVFLVTLQMYSASILFGKYIFFYFYEVQVQKVSTCLEKAFLLI